MKKRSVSLALCVALTLLTVAGCRVNKPAESAVSSAGGSGQTETKAQFVAAVNLILTTEDGGSEIAYNAIKNAIKSDRETASLSSMYNNTEWQWAYYQSGDDWKKRATYSLGNWKNGAGASPEDTASAYLFTDDGSISVMSYSENTVELGAYQDDSVPEVGILLSVSGDEEESLCYTVGEDGVMTIPSQTITAIKAVDGVQTGALAEDGTPRSAVVRITVNSRTLWSGEFMNSAAAEDGAAVTSLTYPVLSDIEVTAGDLVFFSVELDAKVNEEGDISQPSDSADETSTAPTKGASATRTENPQTESAPPAAGEVGTLSLLDGYDSRFTIIRGADETAAMMMAISNLRSGMEEALEAEQFYKTDDIPDSGGYEILIGLTNRAESAEPMRELTETRTNHASDFIIRLVGKKLVFAAANEYALSLAVEYFLNTYCKDDEAVIPTNLNYVYRPQLHTVMLGNANIASYVIQTEKYPSYMTVTAAQDLQKYLMKKTGYTLSVGTDQETAAHVIRIGSPTGEKDGPESLLEDTKLDEYRISLNGSLLSVEGGSTYAVNQGVQDFIGALDQKSSLQDGYSKTGKHSVGSYSLSGGYALKWFDEFNAATMTKKWYVSTDTTQSFDGSTQIRNGIYGEDYFLRDGHLVEVTRKNLSGDGYHAVRLTTQNLMSFRYGYLEVRLIMATNNGACSAVWMNGDGLNQTNMPEIDINENYGIDGYQPNLHSWPESGDHWQMWAHNHLTWETEENWVYPEEGEHFYDTFHYLGMEWTDEYIAFYLDGQVTKYVDASSSLFDVFDQSVVLKLANGIAFNTGYGLKNPPDFLDDVNDFYEEQIIDFVRIYQKNDGVSKLKAKG